MKRYVVCTEDYPIATTFDRADAEELILSFCEESYYEDYLTYIMKLDHNFEEYLEITREEFEGTNLYRQRYYYKPFETKDGYMLSYWDNYYIMEVEELM
jgi:hypothetical protein